MESKVTIQDLSGVRRAKNRSPRFAGQTKASGGRQQAHTAAGCPQPGVFEVGNPVRAAGEHPHDARRGGVRDADAAADTLAAHKQRTTEGLLAAAVLAGAAGPEGQDDAR